jgi:hypothetical protein
MPSKPSNQENGPKTHQRNLSKSNGKEMYVQHPTYPQSPLAANATAKNITDFSRTALHG